MGSNTYIVEKNVTAKTSEYLTNYSVEKTVPTFVEIYKSLLLNLIIGALISKLE